MSNHTLRLLALTALILLALASNGCTPEDDGNGFGEATERCEISYDVEGSEDMPTVVTVRFTVDPPIDADTDVALGSAGVLSEHATPRLLDDGSYEAILLAKSASEISFRVSAESEDMACASDIDVVTTGPLPTDLRDISVEALDPARVPNGYLPVSVIGPFSQAIVDEDGDYVWAHQTEQEIYMVTRVLPSVDGQSLLYLRENTAYESCEAEEPMNDLVRISLDGTQLETIPVGYAHHDFTELPDGTVALIQGDIREHEGELIEGARILEVAPDGTQEVVWSVWDHFEPPEWVHYPDDFCCEWLHANAIQYDPAEDIYYLGMWWTNEVWKIDRADDEVLWRLGLNEDSNFAPATEDTTWFRAQHGFDLTDEGLIIHDNGSLEYSRLVEYELDEGNMTAEQIWEYAPVEQFMVYGLGDAERLDNGLTLATWSTAGQVEIVTPDHEVVWRLNVEMGGGVGYSNWVDTL